MKKIEKAQEISRILNRIYRKVPIPLNHKNKFELVVAVLLSAQCTDERVNQVTPILFKKANTAIKMTKVPKKTIYNIIRPCGLACLLYTSPSPRDATLSRMPSSA